jgi:hypothetical protein
MTDDLVARLTGSHDDSCAVFMTMIRGDGDECTCSFLDRVEAAKEIERLRAERDAFHMDYRMKCDVETKAALVRAERAETEIERLRHELWGRSENFDDACTTLAKLEAERDALIHDIERQQQAASDLLTENAHLRDLLLGLLPLDPDCGDPDCDDCEAWRPIRAALREGK